MRITNKMITTKYIRSLNDLSVNLDKLNTQVTSGRKFSKSSENTSAAIKAYQIRRDYHKGEGYQANVQHAKSSLTNAESALFHIEELVQTASTKILDGINGTDSTDERKIIATELRNIQSQLFQTLNSSASGSYYFGGTNTDFRPFEIDASGKLTYNGYDLDALSTDPATEQMLKSDSLYADIGLNVKFDAGGNIDKSTVFFYSVAGINVVGSGVTNPVDGVTGDVSNNLYNLLGQIASEFESGTFSDTTTAALAEHFNNRSISIIQSITEVGAKASYLDFMTNRLEDQDMDLQERQLAVEGADPASTIIKFSSQEVAFNAALQMGRKIIQPSIFDFMS